MEQAQREMVIGFYKWHIVMKSFHFMTKFVVRHQASDTYLKSTMEKYDKFIEVCMGHHGQIQLGEFDVSIGIINDDNIFEHIKIFNDFLSNLKIVYAEYNDLLNIRDEMESDLHQLVYLLRLN
jgi:hypothetical protein